MKKIFGLIMIFAIVLTSCDGEDGRDGMDAPLPNVFEENVTFTYNADDNNWVSAVLDYNGTFDGDVFLVYLQQAGTNVFVPLPFTIYDDQGEFQYQFNHNANSVQLSIEGDGDISNLAVNRTDNLLVRVAILPAALAQDFGPEDLANYSTMMKAIDASESDIQFLNR